MKKLLLPILFLILAFPAMSQGFLSITGIVTDSATGNPIANHAVTISNDSSSGWFYYNTVYTGSNGFYVDTVPVPLGSQGTMFVRTTDCLNNLIQQVITFGPASTSFAIDFAICNFNSPCQAGFTSQQWQPLEVQFLDASAGGGTTRMWQFGDGATSTQLNPLHQYAQPGYYNVTLSIGALGTPCYDLVTQTIYVSDSTGGGCQAAFISNADTNTLYSYHFWNQSAGNISTFTWNFGDGQTQTITFPGNPDVSHTYAQPGIYLVCLSVQGNDSSCFDVTCDTLIVGIPPSCQAAFSFYSDSLNPAGSYHFIDQSVGNIVSWEWIFGDPGSGSSNFSSLQNPTHVFSAPGIYNVCLTIHGADSVCIDYICHTIVVGTGPGCQANFSYATNPAAGNYEVSFTDLSTGNPATWFWSFGDGTSGNVQNPVHTYAGPGTYNVCLTITGNNCTSVYCQNIVIQDSITYHQVYGQVFAGNFPISAGLVMIFSIDTTGNYQPFVDVFPVDSNGVYYFTMVPDGNYYIMAIPFDSNGYLPTYFGNVISWEQATVISLGTASNPYNINLVPAGIFTPGPGSAGGQINLGDMMATDMMDKVNMILMNEQGNAIEFTRVSASGAFDFSTLDYGTYYLHAEMPGITSDYVMINITVEKPHAEVVMTFTGNSILGMKDDLALVNSWTVYPNPLSDLLSVKIDLKQPSEVIAEIYDLAGHLMIKKLVTLASGINKIEMSVSSLSPGIYALRIHSAAGLNLSTKLIKTK